MEKSRTEHVKFNLMAGIINKIVLLLFPFFIRLLIIKKLGNEFLGLNSLFTSVLSVLNLAELGIGSAIIYYMYKPIEEKNYEEISALTNLYKKIYRFIGVIVLLMGLIIMPFIKHLINGSYPATINIYVIYLIYLLNTIITYFFFSYKTSLLTAYQRNDIVSNISTVTHILLYGSQIIILAVFQNYYLYIFAMPIFSVLNNVVNAIIAKKMYPEISCKGQVSTKFRKNMANKVCSLIGHKIGNIVIGSVDTIIVSAFLGLTILSKYSNYYYIITGISGVLEVLNSSLIASVGNLLVKDNPKKRLDIYKKLTFLNLWVVGVITIVLLVVYQDFMILWVGEENVFESTVTIILFALYFYSWKFRVMGLCFKDAAGLWKEDAIKPYLGIFIDLVLNIVLVKIIGINGILIATIIVMFCVYFPIETKVLFKKLFIDSPKKFVLEVIMFTISISIIGLFTYYCCSIINIDNFFLNFIFKSIVAFFVANILLILFYAKKGEFKFYKNKIKTMLFKDKN